MVGGGWGRGEGASTQLPVDVQLSLESVPQDHLVETLANANANRMSLMLWFWLRLSNPRRR